MEALRLTSENGLCRGVKQSIFGNQCMLFAHNLALWMVLSTVCVTMIVLCSCLLTSLLTVVRMAVLYRLEVAIK